MKKHLVLLAITLLLLISGCGQTSEPVSTQLPIWEVRTNDVHIMLSLQKEQRVEFAGLYLDENGKSVYLLVFDSAKQIGLDELKTQIAAYEKKHNVSFLDAQYSYLELFSAQEKILPLMITYDIMECSIDERNNRLYLAVKQKTTQLTEALADEVDLEMVEIEEVDGTIERTMQTILKRIC